MPIKVKASALARGHWYEYLIRFALGGLTTVGAGLIVAEWGPLVGGLFLAFPAIFPASAMLIEKHEREKKAKAGLRGERRGKEAAALDAAGAALGSIGFVAFGLIVAEMTNLISAGALAIAAVVWLVVSVSAWQVRRRLRIAR